MFVDHPASLKKKHHCEILFKVKSKVNQVLIRWLSITYTMFKTIGMKFKIDMTSTMFMRVFCCRYIWLSGFETASIRTEVLCHSLAIQIIERKAMVKKSEWHDILVSPVSLCWIEYYLLRLLLCTCQAAKTYQDTLR